MLIEEKARLFKALSDPGRLRILKMLQKRMLCVCEITEILGLATSTVSEHLSILKRAAFILEEKDGKWVNYKLNPHPSDPAVVSMLAMLPYILSDDPVSGSDIEKIDAVDRVKLCSK